MQIFSISRISDDQLEEIVDGERGILLTQAWKCSCLHLFGYDENGKRLEECVLSELTEKQKCVISRFVHHFLKQ